MSNSCSMIIFHVSSQKVLILPMEKYRVWKPISSLKNAWWAPIGLEFPWELRNFTKLAIFYLGRETREVHFRILDWSASAGQRGIASVIVGHRDGCSRSPEWERGGRVGSRCGLTFLCRLSLLHSPLSVFVSNTLTHWVIYPLIDFCFFEED